MDVADMTGKTVVITGGELGHRTRDGGRPGPSRGQDRDHGP